MNDLGLIASLIECKHAEEKHKTTTFSAMYELRKLISELVSDYSVDDVEFGDANYYSLDPRIRVILTERAADDYFRQTSRTYLYIPYAAFKTKETLKSYLDKELE